MKSSLKTCQLRLCSYACEMLYIQLQMLRAVPSVNDSNRVMGQMNDPVRWDSGRTDRFRAGSSFADQQTWPFLNCVRRHSSVLCFLHKHKPAFETPDAGEGRSLRLSVGSGCQLTKCWAEGGAEWDNLSKQTCSGASQGLSCLEKLSLVIQVAYTPFSHK